tara:strand:- start:395 stop:598 length:204 start_codon:yes stop_codon:yes gene_type:complete
VNRAAWFVTGQPKRIILPLSRKMDCEVCEEAGINTQSLYVMTITDSFMRMATKSDGGRYKVSTPWRG